MNRLGVGPSRTGTSRRSPEYSRTRSPTGDPSPTVTPEDAPKQCATCSRPLSVGERMFYFLEGGEEFPMCRACLAGSPQRLPNNTGPEMTGRSTEGSGGLLDVVRTFLEEEFDRIDVALGRVPETHPDLPLAQNLEDDARRQLARGQLVEAVGCLRDVRRMLPSLERGRKYSPLTAPWDESVEEMFDRVLARARAMARPTEPTAEEEGGMATASVPRRGDATGASS